MVSYKTQALLRYSSLSCIDEVCVTSCRTVMGMSLNFGFSILKGRYLLIGSSSFNFPNSWAFKIAMPTNVFDTDAIFWIVFSVYFSPISTFASPNPFWYKTSLSLVKATPKTLKALWVLIFVSFSVNPFCVLINSSE